MQNMILNVTPSPQDSRDWIYNNFKEIPDILDLRYDLHPIRNQGNQGTCYAQSAACMKEWQEKKDYGLNEYLSPQFFYNNRFNWYDENTKNDEGMFGRDVMKILKDIGICTEEEYPYGLREKKNNIPKYCYTQASEHKIKGYAQIKSIDSLKQSLNNNGPCLIAFPVYNYTNEMWIQKKNESFKGGHAMTIVGYLEDCFIIRNSWGVQWGDDGYCYYKFKDWGSHWEIWTTIDDESFPQPKPEINSESSESKSDSESTKPKPKPKPQPHVECPKCIIT